MAAAGEGGLSKSASEPAGKSMSNVLNATSASSPYEQEDDPLLATLKRAPPKKRNPNAKWDGRVTGMSIQEYRERKWGVDACWNKVTRAGPSYTMRRPLPHFTELGKKNTGFAVGDVCKALDATKPRPPAFTMGIQFCVPPKEESQGPAEYKVPSTMDPQKHPTIPKNCGARFGSEVLEPRDPTGPAPGDYDPGAIVHSSTLKRPPNFTIQGREAWMPRSVAPGPGIGEYKYEKANRLGKLTPLSYTIPSKGEPVDPPLGSRQYETPGPAHYDCPGAGGDMHAHKSRAAIWKFGSESRGLRN